jgi:hypothetical protein
MKLEADMMRLVVLCIAALAVRASAQWSPPKPLQVRVPAPLAAIFRPRTFTPAQCRPPELVPSSFAWRCTVRQRDTAWIAEFDSSLAVGSAVKVWHVNAPSGAEAMKRVVLRIDSLVPEHASCEPTECHWLLRNARLSIRTYRDGWRDWIELWVRPRIGANFEGQP